MKLRLGLVLLLGSLTTPTHAYVDNALTLGAVVKQSTNITVVKVDKVNRDKRAIIFKKVTDLKGKEAAEEIKHQITDGFHHRTPRTILDWAEQAQESGRVAIVFRNDKVMQVCLGTYWYECAAKEAPWWSMTDAKPELFLAYFGTTEKLRTHVESMLAGKPTVITCLPHGQNGFGAYFHMAFRTAPGSKDFPVQRVRASLDMPAVVYQIEKDPKYFVGLGAADAKDLPPLIEALTHKEPRVARRRPMSWA